MSEDIDNFSFNNVIDMRSAFSAISSLSKHVSRNDYVGDFEYKSSNLPFVKSSDRICGAKDK